MAASIFTKTKLVARMDYYLCPRHLTSGYTINSLSDDLLDMMYH